MAKIRVDVEYPLYDGASVTFNAPCDCTAVDGLIVSYPGGSQTFIFCDAHGEDLSGIGNVFAVGVPVRVILDVTNSKAFIQNGDNNTYLVAAMANLQAQLDSYYSETKIATGSYVGVGFCGQRRPCSLVFDFKPKVVVVACSESLTHSMENCYFWGNSYFYTVPKSTTYNTFSNYVSVTENADGTYTMSWYHSSNSLDTGSNAQLNKSNTTYDYYALG